MFYIQQTTEHGWIRAILVHQIESDLYGRKGKATTNFKKTLPSPQSEFAQLLLNDTYTFDSLNMTYRTDERTLERTLIEYVRKNKKNNYIV